MWIASGLRTEAKIYSFESSGQGKHADVALLADDTQVVNMLREVEWDDDPVQVQVCEHCGYPGCSSGGFVSFRRLGNYVAMVPSLTAYAADAGSWESAEYTAPSYIGARGALLIRQEQWVRLASEIRLPSPTSFGHLSWDEVLLAAQFEAAEDVFTRQGTPFETCFRERLLATDPFVPEEEVQMLAVPQRWAAPDANARLVEPRDAVPLTLVLDDPFVQVTPFARVNDTFALMLSPGIAIAPD